MKKYTTGIGVKELVTLRERKLRTGSRSLFLDYMVNGERVRENLHLYLIEEKNRIDQMQNEETMKTAVAMKAKRTVELQNGNCGFRVRKDILLMDYMKQRQQHYAKRNATYEQTVRNTMLAIARYKGENVKLSNVTKQWLLGFIDWLNESGLGEGTVYTYFTCLVIQLNSAVRDELITSNPAHLIDPKMRPQMHESTRDYLTLEEVRMMANAPCKYPDIKKAFLFACFTGLRISDIRSLTWEQLVETESGTLQIEKSMQKTGLPVYVPVSANAARWLPAKRGRGPVYRNLPQSPTIDRQIALWAKEAGITKHVTFHVARHTNATLLLAYGADIFTVSKILGHKNVKTTEIYGKIVDRRKQEALDSIPDIEQ